MSIEDKMKNLLEKHDCKFIDMLTECLCLWENRLGIRRVDDVFVLNNMSNETWDFWANN